MDSICFPYSGQGVHRIEIRLIEKLRLIWFFFGQKEPRGGQEMGGFRINFTNSIHFPDLPREIAFKTYHFSVRLKKQTSFM